MSKPPEIADRPAPPPGKPKPPKLGFRREANLFLPVSALILIVLSVVAMLSYRNALQVLTERARSDLLAEARQAASILPVRSVTAGELRSAIGPTTNGAVVDLDGSARLAVGDVPVGNLFAPLSAPPSEPQAIGPNDRTFGRVIAFLPLRSGKVLRLDRAMPSLAAEAKRWRSLMFVVALAVGALAVLLLLYLRRLFAPIESLLQTARQLGDEGLEEGDDEIEYLVRRFESAMTALKERNETASAADAHVLGDQLVTLQQTFSRLESGMALIDLDQTVLSLNDVGASILGQESSAVPIALAVLLEDHPELLSTMIRSLETGLALRREECTIRVSGDNRTLGLTLSPLTREDGTLRGWILLFADLTDARLQAEHERLSTSLDQLAELSAGLAHELRNSLASMQGYIALLNRAALTETAAADVEELHREVDQLHRLVEDFLSFARPGKAHLTNVDLLRIAHQAAGDPALGGAPIKVTVVPESAALTVQGDEQLLHRLLRNLLLNAVRAQSHADCEEPVVVRLVSESKGPSTNELRVEIEDAGTGLSAKAEENLFLPFATDSIGGTGLGLAIARRIADLHGAELTVANRPEGGVRATLRFAHPHPGV